VTSVLRWTEFLSPREGEAETSLRVIHTRREKDQNCKSDMKDSTGMREMLAVCLMGRLARFASR
jgi:hypothetical protein